MDKSNEKAKDSCQICHKKFGGVFSSQHQCKRCLRTVCKDCCTKKKSIFTKANTKMQEHRCCDLCWPESENISQYVKHNGLVFNTLSKQGKEWSQLCDIDLIEGSKSPNKNSKSKIEVYFHDAWTQMTASLRQFSGLLVGKIALSAVDGALKHVYEKVSNNNIDLTVGLAVYLLGHCDEKATIKIFDYLQKIAQNVDQKSLIPHIELLCSTNEPPVDSKAAKNLTNYAKNVYRSYTLAYFLNCFPIEIAHHIILETLLSGDARILELVMACLIFQNRALLLADKVDDKGFKYGIWQSASLKGVEKSVKKLRKIIVKTGAGKHSIKQKQKQKDKQKEEEKKQEQIVKTPSQSTSLSKELTQPTQQTQQPQQNQQLARKINEAAQFIRKIQSGELSDAEMNMTDIGSLETYLDSIIADNDRSLNQCEELDRMLGAIQEELYKKGTKI